MKITVFVLIWLFSIACPFSRYMFSQSNSATANEDCCSEDFAQKLETTAKKSKLRWNREALQDSIKSYLRAAEIWKQLRKPDKAIENLRQAGKLEMILAEKQKAVFYFKESLKIADAHHNKVEQAKILSDMSLLALADEQIPEGKKYFEKALIISKETSDPAAQAAVFFSASQFYYVSDLPKSLNYLKQSVKFWKQAGDLEGEATALFKLGYVYADLYDYNSALDVLDSALSKWESLDDLRGQAFTLKAIGTVLSISDEKQKALQYFNKAEQLIPKDIDYFEQAGMYNGFGYMYESYGNLNLSLDCRRKALELFKKDKHLYGQLATTVSLCRLNSLIGNDESALNCFKQGEDLAKSLNDSFYLTLLQVESGNFYLLRNDYQNAELNYKKALRFFNKKNDYRQVSLITAKLGLLSERKNNLPLAQKHFSRSLELNRKVKDPISETETLYHLAKIESLKNETENALNLVTNSVELTEHLYSDVLNAKLKKTFFSNVFNRYELFINLLMKKHRQLPDENYAIQALQAAEKSRARTMLEILTLSEADFNKDADPETVKKEKEMRNLLNAKADRLTDALSRNADETEVQTLNDEINDLENRLEQIKADLKQNSPLYSAIKNPAPFDVAAFQRDVLDENTLLLEFSFGADESYLWLVGKHFVESHVLPPRERLESSIENLRKLIDSRGGMLPDESIEDYQTRVAAAEGEFDRQSKDFSRDLLGQVAGKIINKRLLIVPDGKLHYFPIAALPFPNSIDNQPILLTNETIYEPSAATLALLMRDTKKTLPATKNLLVFSDPLFSAQDSRIVAAGSPPETDLRRAETFRFAESLASLARLDGSKDEADAILNIVGANGSTALNGAAATREMALDASIADYKIVHFATHGLINETRPELSGIVLSQVDGGGQPRNGVVRLQDIYAMNLAADAVILSACSTGIGKEVKGEGLMSLNNAFLQTGAKSVVASLWKVEDQAARELMGNFYREMTSGTATTAEALRRSQVKLRNNPLYRSPFYWAAFTVGGDFQNVPRLAGDKFDRRIYGLLILPFALLLAFVAHRRFALFDRKAVNKA